MTVAPEQQRAIAKITAAQTALDEAQIDPRLIMAAKAIQLMAGQDNDGKPKISADMALAAAMYQAGTGQLLGRDFYVNEKIGRMEGYRGVSRDAVDRGVGEVQIKYRSLTTQEAEDHEIQPGDTAVVCEVYQLRAWQLAQKMGQTYEPISGVGVVRKAEKYDKKTTQRWNDNLHRYEQLPESGWKFLTLEGGMTWRKKAQNRAYKEALRHVPGAPASAAEVLEEATLRGMTEQPPEAARLSMEQAIEWAKQHQPTGTGLDWDAIEEGEFTEHPAQPKPSAGPPWPDASAKTAPTNGKTQPPAADTGPFEPEEGETIWADWRHMDDAKSWARMQNKFNGNKHLDNAYASVKAECNPKSARDMWRAWYTYVMAHEPAKPIGAQPEPEGDDVPLFS